MGKIPDLRKHLFDLEQRLAAPAARISRQEAEELLAEEFVEFGSSGRVLDRASVVAAAATEKPSAWSIADFKVTSLSEDVALATYIATRGTGGSTLRCSIWKRIDGRWRMAFHQGTKIQE
ncbi:MAG TPA: DUF4440 domain-containing protein [Usitatibacter sp.]|nr:DUF4440 domain-containing protein [Usitatibacter sp.]